jgi:pimeloyl-ACP methyl ester carboxylesterase
MSPYDPVTQDEQYDPGFPSTMVPAMFEENGIKYLGTMFISAGEGPHPLIILLHGFPGNEVNYDLAQVFRRQGFNVFVFHYRGCWGSGGDYLWSNLVEDVSAALKFVKSRSSIEQFRIDKEKIVLIGHSMGGFAALFNSIRNDDIKHVASIAGFNAGKFGELIESSRMIFEYSAQHMQPAMDFVKCDSAATLLNELIANKKEWNLLNYLEKLSAKNLLLIGAQYDSTAPLDIHHKSLISALKKNGAENLNEIILETGHSFSDKRIALARIISGWLSGINF